MLGSKRVVCVIPARLDSKRFPRKVLADLKGKPLLQWAYEGALAVTLFDEVVVAVDSEELKEAVEAFGGRALLTDPACQSGTDRLVELQMKGEIEGEIWVNWQGDEPFITQEVIETLLRTAEGDEEIWTLKKKINNPSLIASPHVVKVVTDKKGNALRFSRNPIPDTGVAYKHVGLYAFSAKALEKISTLGVSPLEEKERLEQLRFLENGMAIRVHETDQEIFGIDTKEELERAEQLSFV